MADRAALEAIYQAHLRGGSAMALHLPRIRAMTNGLDVAVEFGVKRGASSSALLLAAARVVSYDVIETRQARELLRVAPSWEYRIEDSRRADVPSCDLLLIDSLHTYAQVKAELEAHADNVRRWLVFHDVITFGVIGADGETGAHLWTYQRGQSVPPEALGIRPAIDELMIRDPSWRVAASYTDSHGLLVLERRP